MSASDVLVYADQFSAGCLFGAQLVWTLAVIPTFRHLTPAEYLRAHTLLTWYGDAFMPFLGLSTAVLGFLRYRVTGEWSALASALALTLASIAASRNLDINKKYRDIVIGGESTPDEIADELVHDRKLWAVQHFIRHLGGFLAFATSLIVPTDVLTVGRPNGAIFGWMDLVMVVVLFMVGREIVMHFVMMARRGRLAGMAAALGID